MLGQQQCFQGRTMTITRTSIRVSVENIASEFSGFINAEIGSPSYAAKGLIIEANVLNIARLHRRWSAEQEIISTEPRNLPLKLVERVTLPQLVEGLFRAWRAMRAAEPSPHSLMTHLPEFTVKLSGLLECIRNDQPQRNPR